MSNVSHLDFSHYEVRAGDSDMELIARAFHDVSTGIARDRSSFELHAVLEVSARAQLMPYVSAPQRHAARRQVWMTGAHYAQLAANTRRVAAISNDNPLADNISAHDAGRTLYSLIQGTAGSSRSQVIAGLADTCLGTTAAAAHLPILLADLVRLPSAIGRLAVTALPWVGLELARPDAFVFIRAVPDEGHVQPAGEVLQHLLALPAGGDEPTGIDPIIRSVLEQGLFAQIGPSLSRIAEDPAESRTLLLGIIRAAASAMVVESDRHVPYGWTHCLTMPAAAARLHGRTGMPRIPLLAAAAYFGAFRHSSGEATLSLALIDQLMTEGPDDSHALRSDMASRAAVRTDAHLVKYMATIFDLCDLDPDASRLYLKAAQRLLTYWEMRVPDEAIAATWLVARR